MALAQHQSADGSEGASPAAVHEPKAGSIADILAGEKESFLQDIESIINAEAKFVLQGFKDSIGIST